MCPRFLARTRVLLFLVLVCSVAFLLVVSLLGFAPAQQEEANAQSSSTAGASQPNIIFVLTDDLDYATAQKMPQIRSLLIEEGTSFEKAFVSHPICCPSRATILTGLYDHNHGVKGNAPPKGGFQTFVEEGHEENTIGTSLQEAGYRTSF